MKEFKLIARKADQGNYYYLPITMGQHEFNIKLDLGAESTLISFDLFAEGASQEVKDATLQYIMEKGTKGHFIGPSGHEFDGYLTCARNVMIGNVVFPEFYYYIVPQNKRLIALLGADFLDYCEYQHKIHGDFAITDFDFEAYKHNREAAIRYEDVIEYIDNLTEQTDEDTEQGL